MSLPYFGSGLVMCIAVVIIGRVLPSNAITFILQVIVGGLIYASILYFTKDDMLKYLIEALKEKMARKRV